MPLLLRVEIFYAYIVKKSVKILSAEVFDVILL